MRRLPRSRRLITYSENFEYLERKHLEPPSEPRPPRLPRRSIRQAFVNNILCFIVLLGLLLIGAVPVSFLEADAASRSPVVHHDTPDIQNHLDSPLSTQGRYIMDSKGNHVILSCVSWVGFDGGAEPSHLWDQGDTIEAIMKAIRDAGFNCIRLPLSLDSFLFPGTPDWMNQSNLWVNYKQLGDCNPTAKCTPAAVLDYFLTAADHAGLKVILDLHDLTHGNYMPVRPFNTEHYNDQTNNTLVGLNDPGNKIGDKFNLDDVVTFWSLMATHYAQNPAVIGADLLNEPHDPERWGTNDLQNDWRMQAEKIGQAIQTDAPRWLIIIEGIGPDNMTPYADGDKGVGDSWWGENLSRAGAYPIQGINNLVYSVHSYGPAVWGNWWVQGVPTILREHWARLFGYLMPSYPVWVGEFGAQNWSSTDGEVISQLLEYIYANGGGFSYWTLFQEDSGDTGGLIPPNSLTPDHDKVAILKQFETVTPDYGSGITGHTRSGYCPTYEDPTQDLKRPGFPPVPKLGGSEVTVKQDGLIDPPPYFGTCPSGTPTPTPSPVPTPSPTGTSTPIPCGVTPTPTTP